MDAICAEPLQLGHALALLGDEARALDGVPLGLRQVLLKHLPVHGGNDTTDVIHGRHRADGATYPNEQGHGGRLDPSAAQATTKRIRGSLTASSPARRTRGCKQPIQTK